MTLLDLTYMTRLYARDNNSYVFSDTMIRMFINQAIDRLKQHKIFSGMEYLDDGIDKPTFLPPHYHYMLALFAASRCFDCDERHYEGVEKRNEFEQILNDLINDIESGVLQIYDENGQEIVAPATPDEIVNDVYFNYTIGGVE